MERLPFSCLRYGGRMITARLRAPSYRRLLGDRQEDAPKHDDSGKATAACPTCLICCGQCSRPDGMVAGDSYVDKS